MLLKKYGTATHVYIPIVKRAVVDFAVSADWTPAAGDVKISKDGGAAANVTNLPTAIAMGNTAMWDFSITATEMEAAFVIITVADSATKAVEDQAIIIQTFGHASADLVFDLGTAMSGQAVASVTGAVGSVTGNVGGNVAGSVGSVTGAVGSVTGAVGSVTGNVGGNVAGSTGSVTGNVGGNVAGSVGSVTGAVGSVAAGGIAATSFAANAVDSNAVAASAVTEIADGVLDRAIAEPSGIHTWPASIRTILQSWGVLSRNKQTQDATTLTVRNDADSGTLWTHTVSDDGTTFTKGEGT